MLAGASPATAQAPGGGTAPAYPGNTLTVQQIAPIVAGTTTKVRLSGHAEWGGPTDNLTIPYTLSLYVQNADVDPNCEQSYGGQLQKAINVPTLGAAEAITDWVLSDNVNLTPNVPASGIDWSYDSILFVVTPGVSHVVLCGYQRFIVDDAAWYQLPVNVQQPTCALTRASVRRGTALGIRCNFHGSLTVRLSGARKRTMAVTIGSGGTGKLSTRTLRRGRYRVSSLNAGTLKVRVGKPSTFRVR